MLQGGESCSACTGEEQLGLGMGSRCMWAVSPNTIMTHIGEAGGQQTWRTACKAQEFVLFVCAELPLLTSKIVGKVGRGFPTFI